MAGKSKSNLNKKKPLQRIPKSQVGLNINGVRPPVAATGGSGHFGAGSPGKSKEGRFEDYSPVPDIPAGDVTAKKRPSRTIGKRSR